MKAVLIVHDAALDAEVQERLAALAVDSYTKFPHALGQGHRSEPHLDSDVWPGVNCATLVVVEEEQARAVMAAVRHLRQTLGSEGVKAFLWEIQDLT